MKLRLFYSLSCVLAFLIGGSYWASTVKADYDKRPGVDDAEAKWSVIESFFGAGMIFSGLTFGAEVLLVTIMSKRN